MTISTSPWSPARHCTCLVAVRLWGSVNVMSLTQRLTHHCSSRLSMTFLHSMITSWSAVMFCNFRSLFRFFQSKQYYNNSGGKNINCESKLKVNESSQVSQVSQGPRFSHCHKFWPSREPKINSSRIEWSDLIKTIQVENMLLCYSPRHLTPFPECQPQEFRHDNSLDSIFTADKSDISEVSSRSLCQAKVDKLQNNVAASGMELSKSNVKNCN